MNKEEMKSAEKAFDLWWNEHFAKQLESFPQAERDKIKQYGKCAWMYGADWQWEQVYG